MQCKKIRTSEVYLVNNFENGIRKHGDRMRKRNKNYDKVMDRVDENLLCSNITKPGFWRVYCPLSFTTENTKLNEIEMR